MTCTKIFIKKYASANDTAALSLVSLSMELTESLRENQPSFVCCRPTNLKRPFVTRDVCRVVIQLSTATKNLFVCEVFLPTFPVST